MTIFKTKFFGLNSDLDSGQPIFHFRLNEKWEKNTVLFFFKITTQKILPEPQSSTYFCFWLSDKVYPDGSRQLLSSFWRWEKLFVVLTTLNNFGLYEQFFGNF